MSASSVQIKCTDDKAVHQVPRAEEAVRGVHPSLAGKREKAHPHARKGVPKDRKGER
jgi:hypothetical protein